MPISTALSTSSASPTDGSIQVRRHTLRKNSTAQITAMNIRMFLPGSTAFWPV